MWPKTTGKCREIVGFRLYNFPTSSTSRLDTFRATTAFYIIFTRGWKLVTAACALVAGLALADGGVESANVVGSQNIEVKPGFNMIALNFQPIGNAAAFAITGLVQNVGALIAGGAAGNSDQIQVWDPSTKEFTGYFYRAYSSRFTAGPGWVKSGATGTITSDTIPAGAGVWFARPTTAPATATLILSGEVGATAFTHNIASGFNMISSAFPVDIKLNGGPIDWATCGAIAGGAAGNSDQIQVWDPTTQEFTGYFYRAYSSRFTAGPAWVKSGATGSATTDSIPAGKGFWYARPDAQQAGTLTEASPLQ